MENKRRKSRAQVSEELVEKSSQEIPFELFFAKCVTEGKLKHWQRKEIFAFFSDLKLKEKEDLQVYEAALRKF